PRSTWKPRSSTCSFQSLAGKPRSSCRSLKYRSSRSQRTHGNDEAASRQYQYQIRTHTDMAPPKKKVVGLIKLQIQAGNANPAPPVGPALGQHGVNIMEFCKAYNAATE